MYFIRNCGESMLIACGNETLQSVIRIMAIKYSAYNNIHEQITRVKVDMD